MESRHPHFNCVELGNGSRQHPWHLLEMSLTGARIRVPVSDGIPDRFTLVLQSEEVKLMKCRVVWRSEAQIGVRFEDPPADDLDRSDELSVDGDTGDAHRTGDGRSLHVAWPRSLAMPQDSAVPGACSLALPEPPEWVKAEELVRRLFVAGQRVAQDRERLLGSPPPASGADRETPGETGVGSPSKRPLTVWAAVVGLWASTVLVLLGAFVLISRWG
ncbi:PilZ domain-containing protein [Xanthobacteraceae bacterium Astr-EGSB]|uniref:PilZ domain-containing protein n=1 Tax=Astrobacterium formosum TaxID=3069710 RepID=UPI0027B28E1C|nr:PilZ domain-containing protein [Xanthobacteraceae bacterium Astr-EGSB]